MFIFSSVNKKTQIKQSIQKDLLAKFSSFKVLDEIV